MIFTSLEHNPIAQILILPTPKKLKTKIKCIDELISTTNFHQFTKDELNSFFNLLSNGQSLEILKSEYNLKSEIDISSLLPLINETESITEQNVKNITSFYILRCSLTFMSQNMTKVPSSSLKKMYQLLLFSINNNNSNATFSNLSKQTFLLLLSISIDKVNADMLEILQFFFNIENNYYNESLIVLTSMVKQLLNKGNSKIDSFLLDYSSQFILKANNFNEVKDSFTDSIFPLLELFDKEAISFLTKIISKFNFIEVEKFLRSIPDHLLNYQKSPFFSIPDLINSDKEIFQFDIEKIHSAQLLPFKKISSFDPSYNINFTIPKFIVNDYFPKDLINILFDFRMIAQKMQEANKLLSELFIKLIQNENSKTEEDIKDGKLFDIAIMSLFICDDNYLNLIILRSKIFAPNISTYDYQLIKDEDNNEKKDYELIFSVRTICIDHMRSLFSIIFAFLYSYYHYPLFVGDIFAILTNDHIPNLTEMTKQNKDSSIEQLCQIAGDYQTIQFRKLASQDKISYSRVEILFYILKLLKKEENTQLLIRNELFMQLIVSFLCEEKSRPIILQTLEEVFTKRELDLSDCFSGFIKFIIMHNDDNKLRYDTLMSLNRIISEMPDYKEYFSELVDPLIDSLNSISKSSNETDENFPLMYMKSIFKFVSLASIESSIESTKKMLSAIQVIEGDDPSDETFNTILNVITGNNKKYKFEFVEESKSFQYETIEIKYPGILGVLVKAFQKSSKFIGILQMLKDSCSKSRENSIKCHEGQIDLLIIDIIKELIEKNKKVSSNNKDEEIIINSLQLFSNIGYVSSSANVVQNFFSLFNEIDDHVVSVFHSIFYIILNDLTQVNDSVDEYLPINSNSPVVQVQGINCINLNYGFSIYLSIYLNNINDENSSSKFFSISDDKRNKIELFNEAKIMKLRISKNDETVHTIEFEQKNFEYNSWNDVIFSFLNLENKLSISALFSASKEKQSTVYTINQVFDLDKNISSFIFGGINPSIKKGVDKSAIKFIGIYHLLDDNESYELFNSITNQVPNKTVGTIDFLSKDGCLILSTNFSQQKINAKLVGPSVFIPNSFKNVFINNDMLLMIYPLLLRTNFTYCDGKKIPDFEHILFMILFNVLKSSLKAQILFYKSKGVECLAHILSQTESLSFQHYQNIFQLFKKIKFMQLKMELMQKILLNMNIWINADALSQLQVYRDWSRTLNAKYNDYTNKFINFHSLLRDLRMFYWFSPVEKNIICINRKEELDSKIVDIRSSILQILHTMSQKPDLFGYDELTVLISHCTSCRDSKQVLDLLSFVRLIIVSPETPLRNIENIWTQVARLHSLLYSKQLSSLKKSLNLSGDLEDSENDENENMNENIVLAVIEIFVTLHFLKIIEQPKVNTHVSIIIDLLPVESVTNHFFVKFFPFAIKYPEVTPLLFYLGMKMSQTELKIIVNKVNPDVKFSSTKYWDFYPVLFGLKFGGENIDFISKFLAYSVHDNWDKVFQMITLIGIIFDVDTDEFKSKFLSLVCMNIMNTSSLFQFEYLHNFFDVALLHIFFRKANDMNSNLNALFMESPFSSECTEKEEKPSFSSEISKDHFFEKLIQNSEKIQNKENDIFQSIFGLRFDKEGHWLDSKLAIQLIQLSLKTKVQTFHNASSLLLAFLLREQPNDPTVGQYIQQLISKKVIDKPFHDFLNHIHKKENPGKNYFECFEIFNRERSNINTSILSGIANFARKMEKVNTKMREETAFINSICNSKKEKEDEADRILNHYIQNNSIIKKYSKEYLSNEDSVKTATNNQEYLNYRASNFGEIRQNFFNDQDCLVKYKFKEIKDSTNNQNERKSQLPPTPSAPKAQPRATKRNNIFRQNTILPKLQKEKSTMFITTPKKYKISSQFFEEPISFSKIENDHSNQIQLNALYYSLKDPIHSTKVRFTVNGSKVLISNKDLNAYSIDSKSLIFKEFDANEIKEMIFMPNHNLPVGIEIITKFPKRSFYITLLSDDALNILKKIASFIEFKTVFIQTQLPNFFFKSLGITKKWREGRMSNFEYLMKLNRFSGRTFSNIDSYPIFPRLEIKNGANNQVEKRDLNEPINSNFPVSDPIKIVSLLSANLPFKSKFNYESNFVRSPRRSPKKINFTSIESSDNNNSAEQVELTPEFFYDQKCFKTNKGDFLSSLENVYNRRKLLENSDISGFIDLVWGVKRDAYNSNVSCFLPFQLFKKKHPKSLRAEAKKPKKKSVVTYHDDAHVPAFVAHEMSSLVSASEEALSASERNYVYSFVCVDSRSKYVYRVDIDPKKKTLNSRDTWSKLQGNIFAATRIKTRQQSQMLFAGISLKSIFSSQTLINLNQNENENELPIEIDGGAQTSNIGIAKRSSSTSAIRQIQEDDSQSESGNFFSANVAGHQLKIVSAFPFDQSSALTNVNNSLKTFNCRTDETSLVDSEIVAGVGLLSCDKNVIVAAGKIGSVVSIYKDFAFFRTVPTYRGRITAINVSASFGIIAATTADSFLVIMNIGDNKSKVIQKSVSINEIQINPIKPSSTTEQAETKATNEQTESTTNEQIESANIDSNEKVENSTNGQIESTNVNSSEKVESLTNGQIESTNVNCSEKVEILTNGQIESTNVNCSEKVESLTNGQIESTNVNYSEKVESLTNGRIESDANIKNVIESKPINDCRIENEAVTNVSFGSDTKDDTNVQSTSDPVTSPTATTTRTFTPKNVLITPKWGFIVVYSQIDENAEVVDQSSSHRLRCRRSKLDPDSFTHLSVFIARDQDDDENRERKGKKFDDLDFFNDGEFASGVVDIFTSDGEFIRRSYVENPIVSMCCFSSYQDFDFVVFADEEGRVFLFEAFYAEIERPIMHLKEKEIECLIVPPPYQNIFAFSSNGDIDVIPIDL